MARPGCCPADSSVTVGETNNVTRTGAAPTAALLLVIFISRGLLRRLAPRPGDRRGEV